jgi:predicted nuclease of predicted toxin-antitoxin system
VKLLLDENLSVQLQLTVSLSALYPGSEQVHNVHLGSSNDDAIWDYAKQHGFAIVSKDSDFAERSVLERDPPKIIWIRLGNCSTADVEHLLCSAHETIRSFIEEDEETCLLLGRA